jgi:hypothetical protein
MRIIVDFLRMKKKSQILVKFVTFFFFELCLKTFKSAVFIVFCDIILVYKGVITKIM